MQYFRAKDPSRIPEELSGWGLFRLVGYIEQCNAYLCAPMATDPDDPVVDCKLVGAGWFAQLEGIYEEVTPNKEAVNGSEIRTDPEREDPYDRRWGGEGGLEGDDRSSPP